jgi:hypothetical protein
MGMQDTAAKVLGTLIILVVSGFWLLTVVLLFAAGQGGPAFASIIVPPIVVGTAFLVNTTLGIVGLALAGLCVVLFAMS